MTDEELRRERIYQQTMMVFKDMLEKKLISREEYNEVDTRMEAKYSPKFGSLLSKINLIK